MHDKLGREIKPGDIVSYGRVHKHQFCFYVSSELAIVIKESYSEGWFSSDCINSDGLKGKWYRKEPTHLGDINTLLSTGKLYKNCNNKLVLVEIKGTELTPDTTSIRSKKGKLKKRVLLAHDKTVLLQSLDNLPPHWKQVRDNMINELQINVYI